jgi:iron complex outermembrane receptor protein
VVYSNGMSIPGVTVIVMSTKAGTSTDFDGNYTIRAKETYYNLATRYENH